MDVFVYGVSLALGMERALMMGRALLSRDLLDKLNLMYKAHNCKNSRTRRMVRARYSVRCFMERGLIGPHSQR
jgi:hypothetical protein